MGSCQVRQAYAGKHQDYSEWQPEPASYPAKQGSRQKQDNDPGYNVDYLGCLVHLRPSRAVQQLA
jgi:hypothetical protein